MIPDSDSDALSFPEKASHKCALRRWKCAELKHLEAQPSVLGREVLREGPRWSRGGPLPRTGSCSPAPGRPEAPFVCIPLLYHKGLEWQWTGGIVTPKVKHITQRNVITPSLGLEWTCLLKALHLSVRSSGRVSRLLRRGGFHGFLLRIPAKVLDV